MTRTINGKRWTPAAAEKALRVLNEDIKALGESLAITETWADDTYREIFGISKAEGTANAKRALEQMLLKRTEFTLKAKAEGLL